MIEYATATGAKGDGQPLEDPLGRKARLVAESEARNAGLAEPVPGRVAELRAEFERRAGGPYAAHALPDDLHRHPSAEELVESARLAVETDEPVVFDRGRHVAVPDRLLDRADVDPEDYRYERTADGYGAVVYSI